MSAKREFKTTLTQVDHNLVLGWEKKERKQIEAFARPIGRRLIGPEC